MNMILFQRNIPEYNDKHHKLFWIIVSRTSLTIPKTLFWKALVNTFTNANSESPFLDSNFWKSHFTISPNFTKKTTLHTWNHLPLLYTIPACPPRVGFIPFLHHPPSTSSTNSFFHGGHVFEIKPVRTRLVFQNLWGDRFKLRGAERKSV